MIADTSHRARPVDATIQRLLEIAQRFGTPTYAFDTRRLRAQAAKLRAHLPAEVEILYSLKANASLGICDVLADCGLGADVASAGELATAVEAGFPPERIFVAGPFKLQETLAQLRRLPQAVISVDSLSELQTLAEEQARNRVVLRLRPDFDSCAAVSAGCESRFGLTADDLGPCAELIRAGDVNVVGFHVFAGSQALKAEGVIAHLRGALDLSLRAADRLGIAPALLNLGGGFGIPYAADEQELDLAPIGEELEALADRASGAQLLLELGRYLVAQAGWYVTSVVGLQSLQGRPAVIVDGGTHQRADMCGLCLKSRARPPVVLTAPEGSPREPTGVWGCLSLPADILAEAALLPQLRRGDVLAFADAGAYGLWSSPALFHGSPLPAEVAFDEGEIQVMRSRPPAESILQGQRHVRAASHAGDRYA